MSLYSLNPQQIDFEPRQPSILIAFTLYTYLNAIVILVWALFFGAKSQILKQQNRSVGSVEAGIFNLGSIAITDKGNLLLEGTLQNRDHGMQRIFKISLSIWPSSMAHNSDRFWVYSRGSIAFLEVY